VTRLLTVPQEDLHRCDAIDPDALSQLKEDEIRLMLEKGYHDGSKERAKARGISERAFQAIGLIRTISREQVSVLELLNMAKTLLKKVEALHASLPLVSEYKRFVEQLERNQTDRVLLANASLRMAAVADVLFDQKLISREALRQVKWVAARAGQ
jgi:hypothetical protein